MSSKGFYTLLLIILFAGAVRICTISGESVTGDEVFSRQVALQPISASLATMQNDLVHPPLYYLLLKGGTKIWGASAFGIRLLSIAFGLAALAVAAAIGSRLPGARSAGLLAAAMLGVNEYLVLYSQQARSYSFYTFLVLILVLWLSAVTSSGEKPQRGIWFAGWLLMVLLIYTHYVAALYILSAVIAILLCNVPFRTKSLALLTSTLAAVSLVPWLMAIAGVYQAKRGVGQNLDWQKHPDLYQLKMVLASSIGVVDIKGATTMAFILVVLLSISALMLLPQGRRLRDSPTLVAIALLALVPPVGLYGLSTRPINLPLFGLRHLLPSLALLSLLCCYGLEALADRLKGVRLPLYAAGGVILLVIATIPMANNIINGPVNPPYADMAKDVLKQKAKGRQVYATWFWGLGLPVNFYCNADQVKPLPADISALPNEIVLLYRSNNPQEMQVLETLRRSGYTPGPGVSYMSGPCTHHGASMACLAKAGTR